MLINQLLINKKFHILNKKLDKCVMCNVLIQNEQISMFLQFRLKEIVNNVYAAD